MIKINLLPKKPLRSAFKYEIHVLLLIIILNLLTIGLFYSINARAISNLKSNIEGAKREIANLDPIYREYLAMEQEKKEIQRRIHAIDTLKQGRALAARTLYDLTSIVQEKLWLKSFKKTENRFELEGRSIENDTISSFVESLSKVPYFSGVELKSVEDAAEEGLVLKKFIIQGNISI